MPTMKEREWEVKNDDKKDRKLPFDALFLGNSVEETGSG